METRRIKKLFRWFNMVRSYEDKYGWIKVPWVRKHWQRFLSPAQLVAGLTDCGCNQSSLCNQVNTSEPVVQVYSHIRTQATPRQTRLINHNEFNFIEWHQSLFHDWMPICFRDPIFQSKKVCCWIISSEVTDFTYFSALSYFYINCIENIKLEFITYIYYVQMKCH